MTDSIHMRVTIDDDGTVTVTPAMAKGLAVNIEPQSAPTEKDDTVMTTFSPYNPDLFDPAVDHALHERFRRLVAKGTAPPKGSPLYDNLYGGYVRHEARQGRVVAKATEHPEGGYTNTAVRDAAFGRNGGLPYAGNPADASDGDISTQDSCLAIIAAVCNAARRAPATGQYDGAMAKAIEASNNDQLSRARLTAKIQYQTDPAFRAALDAPTPRRLATLEKVEERLTELAKSREVSTEDAQVILQELQGGQ